MKTLHTIYTNFAKRVLMALALITMGVSTAWGAEETWLHTFTNGNLPKAAGTIELNNKSWEHSAAGYMGWDNNNNKGIQIGSGSNPVSSYTLSTSDFSGTITQVVVNASMASDATATLKVSVDGTIYGTKNLTTSATNHTFSGTESGEIVITFNQPSTKKALYIKSISVTYVVADAQQYTLSYQAGDGIGTLKVEEGANLLKALDVLGTPTSCDAESTEFIGWTTTEITTKTNDVPVLLDNSFVMPGSDYMVYAVFAKKEGEQTLISNQQTTISGSTSGKTSGVLSWSSEQNDAANAPAWNTSSEEFRFYYNSEGKGCSMTITAEDGVTITGIKITASSTSYTPTVNYNIDEGSDQTGTWSSAEMTITDLSAKSFKFRNANKENKQLRFKNVEVTYSKISGEYTYSDYITTCSAEVTVTLNPDGGTGISTDWIADGDNYTMTVDAGTEITLPTLQKTGYNFAGWHDGETTVASPYTTTKDITLTAQWIAQQYDITYKDQGNADYSGENIADLPTSHTYDQTTTLVAGVKTGYTFGGWYKESDCSGTAVTTLGATEYTENITLYAQWTANTYTVQFNANGGTGSMDNQSFTYDANHKALSANTFTRTGYNFTGWNTAADGTGTPYADKAEVKNLTDEPNGVVTLFAQWEEKRLTNFRTLCEYTVTWELAGGQIDGNTDDIVDTYTNGQEIQKPADPTREGHWFLGWTPEFVEGSKMQSQSLVYTAQWFELIVTKLQWSEDYYTATMEADNDFPDLTILPNDFAGVLTYQSSNLAVATIAADGTITLVGTGTTTITASIAADHTYLAASDSYELTVVESNCKWVEVTIDQIQYGDEIIIAVPGKDAYGADMLYMLQDPQAAQNPKVYQMDVSDLLNTDNVAATVIWNIRKRDDNQANFTIYRNGSTTDRLAFITNYGVRVGGDNADSIFTITNEGYFKSATTNHFLRMSNSKDWRHYTTSAEKQTFTFYKRVCLDSEHYWLTWDATDGQFADGSKQIVKDYAVGTTINKPLDPTRTGYDFAGWSTDGVNVVTPADKMPEENLIYSAVWQIKSYTVTWDADGGQFADGKTVIEQTYEYGAIITKPADPTRTGYTFKGWSPNVPDKMSTDNLKFVAQWQVNQYTVTWDPGEGGHWGDSFVPIVENYNYGDPINKPTNPEKAGYVFDKWEPDVVATMPNNNLTYTAKWNEAFCDAYTFHTGNANVWNDPQEQICFEFKANHEWQIINYVIPISDAQSHFLVAYKGWPQIAQGSLGGHSKSATSTWSATMYLAPSMDSNDGNGSPKVGHAKGAVGTLRIFDDSNWDNLYVGFIPNGYKLKFGANEYDFIHHEDAEYRSEIVEYNATTANNNVSVGVINTSNAYVKTDHTQEGMRHIFLKVNSNWKSDGAKFAIYYFNSDSDNGWSNFMKEVPGETDMYEGWIPENYSKVIFVRLNPNGGINWDAKWNQTGNLTLKTDKTLYTIPSGTWDNADDTNWSTYQRKGKFRIYNNSWDKNWYVHFYPHYVITFDKNAADATGTMPPQALPLDANPKTIVLNECTFERRGYDFTGWNTDVAITADGNSVAANGNVKDKATISNINKDITLKAQWKAQAYTVNYKDQGDVAYSGENLASLPKTHTYDQTTTLVAGVKTGYTFGGWYTTPECDGTAVTELGAQDYTANITLYAKWTFAMEYNITNTVPIYVTSAVGQTIKATTPLTLAVSNMPVGTTIALSAPNIKFYHGSEEVTELTTKYTNETFSLTIAYTPTIDNTTEQPTITLSVLGNEKTFDGLISARSLPANFVIAAKWGNNWYAMPANMDSQSSTEGLLIEVDNPSDPTKALAAPNTTKYGLKSVYTSNSSADRYAANGNRLVFVEDVTEATPITNKTLYNGGDGSSSKTNIQVYAQYTGYYTNNPDRYEWIPTTTDLKDYTLTSAAVLAGDGTGRTVSLDNHGIFGTLLQDKSYNGMVRLLLVDNFYKPIELQVVEWKQHSVSVMYTGAGTKYTTKVGNNAESSVQALPAIDHAVYSLSTSDLTTATNQPLIITIKDNANATIGTVKLTIPAVVATDKSSTALGVTADIAKATSIVVLDGATLTADATKYTYDDITVYPGGKLVIGQSAQLGMYTLTLRAGSSWGAADYEHKYPQFVLNNSATGAYSNSSGQINLDYVTTKEQYYTFVAPFAVNTKDIKYPVDIYGSNVPKANSGSFEFQYYDGEARAAGSPGWKVVEEGAEGATLEAGQGYTFLGMPKKIDGTRQKYGIHRIPMKVAAGTAQSHETVDQSVPLSVYLSAKNNNSGWNLVGNPYMATVTGLDNNDIQVGQLVHTNDANGNWTGGWHWDDPTTGQRFLVIPSNDGQSYTAVQASHATLPAFKNFFVQISNKSANAMSIPVANREDKNLAPARHADTPLAHDIELAIVLEQDDAHADQLDFLLNDLYSAAFDFNGDFTKMMNATLLNLYGVHTDDNLSFVAVDHHTARQSIPIGYQVPAAGEYTLRMSDQPYVMWDEIEAIYVTDHEMSPALTTDLMSTPYTFFVHQAETNNERFTLSVQTKAKTENGATDLDNVLSEGEQIHKFIYQDKIFILHHGVVYDATGKRVITINK